MDLLKFLMLKIHQFIPHSQVPMERVKPTMRCQKKLRYLAAESVESGTECDGERIWAMVNTHYMVDGHPIHNKDPYNDYYKSLWTIGWLAPINGY